MNRFYTVSFGDSSVYSTSSLEDTDALRQRFINALGTLFPTDNVQSFVTLDINEVSEMEAAEYPHLNVDSPEEICAILKREVQVADSIRELTSNAPFDVTGALSSED